MSWKHDYRTIYGKSVRIHPGVPKSFVMEQTRWLVMRDGLREVAACVPRNERRLYVTVAEMMAYCDYRYDLEKSRGDAAEPRLF